MGTIKSMNEGQPQPQTVNIRPEDLDDISCENCEGKVFREASMFKRLSALLSPSGKEQVIPVPVFRCDDCGHINDAFLPKSLKEKK